MKLTAKEIATVGMMVAIIEVSKVLLASIPNVELTSFWIIIFTLCFDKLVLFVIPTFIIVEGFIFGFEIWWITLYLYAWPLLALMTHLFRKMTLVLNWAIFSAAFGLSFGLLDAIAYFIVGAVSGGFESGMYIGFSRWVSGIPFDIVHCVGNFVIMCIFYPPMKRVVEKVKEM